MLTLTKKQTVFGGMAIVLGAALILSISTVNQKPLEAKQKIEESEQTAQQIDHNDGPVDQADQSFKTNKQSLKASLLIKDKSEELLQKSHEHTDECSESLRIAEENLKSLNLDPEEENYAEEKIDKILLEAKNDFEKFVYDEDGNLVEKSEVLTEFEIEIQEFEDNDSNIVQATADEFDIN